VEILAGRLVLRPPQEVDLDAVQAACQDPEISRFIPFVPVPYTADDARAWLAGVARDWTEGEELTFAIVDRETDRFLGVVTIRLRDGGSVGYWLDKAARGSGVMTAAVKAVVAWAKDERRISRLVLTTHPDNVASQRVAERAGFTRVGTTDHEPAFRDGTTTAILFELA
jgi:RimJ/RimL family protein N-acetyltransferase